MDIPACKVPTRATWKQLRASAGGKEGLSKVSMGKSLDAFHGAVAKNDVGAINRAIPVLEKAAKAYLADLKKDKHNELASVVSREILGNLDKFVTALETTAKTANQQLNEAQLSIEHKFTRILEITNRGVAQILGEIQKINQELQAVANRYKLGVPTEEKPNVLKLVKESATRVTAIQNANADLDKELLSLVSTHLKNHRDVIDKFNSQLGAAKGETKKCKEEVNTGKARLQELAIILKQG